MVAGLVNLEQVSANEIIYVYSTRGSGNQRQVYCYDLLRRVLEQKVPQYGNFELRYAEEMNRERAFQVMKTGGNMHVFESPTKLEYERELLPICIPTKKGIQGIRLFFIRNSDQEIFSSIKNLEELKGLKLGSGETWTITPVFEKNGFKVIKGNSYEGLFVMLELG